MIHLPVNLDSRFSNHFKSLKQVYLSVTNDCNLRCSHCLYKPWLKNGDDMPPEVSISLMRKFYELGAIKLSLLGGEPTIYGRYNKSYDICTIINEAKKIGFEYIRIVTNGMFNKNLLRDNRFSLIDEITFSIDGINKKSHEAIRGKGTFKKTINNLKHAVELGFNVNATVCVHRNNINIDRSKSYETIHGMIRWAEKNGISRINFHPILKMGILRDEWVGNNFIEKETWVNIYNNIREKIDNVDYSIPVRIPKRFVSTNEFYDNPKYFSYCPIKMGERVEIHPNGHILVCALLKGTKYTIAKFRVENDVVNITWAKENNELDDLPFDLSKDHPCALIRKNFGNSYPLCISFKPKQNEIIWSSLNLEETKSLVK